VQIDAPERQGWHSKVPSQGSSAAMPGMDQSIFHVDPGKYHEQKFNHASPQSLNDTELPSSTALDWKAIL
jgi:hypothetical protein